MTKNSAISLWVALLLSLYFASGQERATKLEGRIISTTNDVASVQIYNLIGDFIYFCEQDSLFKPMVAAGDKLSLWQFMKGKSEVYRSENGH